MYSQGNQLKLQIQNDAFKLEVQIRKVRLKHKYGLGFQVSYYLIEINLSFKVN